MNHQDRETEEFKTKINLVDFMRSYGYEYDSKESTSHSAIMRGPHDQKLAVTNGEDGHWIFYDWHNLDNHGSIFDFLEHETGERNFGRIRREIRQWCGGEVPSKCRMLDPLGVIPKAMTRRDFETIRDAFKTMPVIAGDPILEERGIEWSQVSHLLTGQIKKDDRGNLVFPHRNQEGICGLELKNHDWKGFAPGGMTCLWRSNNRDATSLVVGEAVLDVISYHILNPDPSHCLISTGGTWGLNSAECLTVALKRLPKSAEPNVILAFDNDRQGDVYTEQIKNLCQSAGILSRVDRPLDTGYDWNRILMEQKGLKR